MAPSGPRNLRWPLWVLGGFVLGFWASTLLPRVAPPPCAPIGNSAGGHVLVDPNNPRSARDSATCPPPIVKEVVKEVIKEVPAAADAAARVPCGAGHSGRNFAIACAFNHKPDPQRAIIAKADFEYIKTWYTSIQYHQPGIQGVLIGNMFADKEFQKRYPGIIYVNIDPATDPIINDPEHVDRSINDLVYYFALDWIEKNVKDDDYVIVSDLHDVTFLQNPFPWMRTTDEVMGFDQLYAAEEFRPRTFAVRELNLTRIARIKSYWNTCFGSPMPDRWDHGALYSSGIIGGRRSIIVEFHRVLIRVFGLSSAAGRTKHNCNMVSFAYVIQTHFKENVIIGYPFHSKFMEAFTEDDPWPGFIKHK